MADVGFMKAARRYADALFELARESGSLDQVTADVTALKSMLDAEPNLLREIVDPKRSATEKKSLVEGRLLSGRHRLVGNLLRVLLARRREEVLRDFFKAYAERLESMQGLLRVSVETATPLGESDLQDLSRRLGETTGRPVTVETRVRPEILGGMRFVVDSQLIDGSIASRLERLKTKLLTTSV